MDSKQAADKLRTRRRTLGLTPEHYPEAIKILQETIDYHTQTLADLKQATQCPKCKRMHQATPAEHATLCPNELSPDRVKTWNTGRQYSEHGQRMAATSYKGSTVFVDFDRHIDGVIKYHCGPYNAFIREYVMTAYDKNQYEYPMTQDMRDAIQFIQDHREELLK